MNPVEEKTEDIKLDIFYNNNNESSESSVIETDDSSSSSPKHIDSPQGVTTQIVTDIDIDDDKKDE